MTSSRTVSGSDSFFVCRTLFKREDFHLTPSVHKGVPTVIRVDARGTLIRIKCTNTYKITTHNTDEDSDGVSVLEWIALKTVIEQNFFLPVQSNGRLKSGERVMCITLYSGEDETDDEVVEEEKEVIDSKKKVPINEMKVLNVRCKSAAPIPTTMEKKKKKEEEEEEEDHLILKLPPPPRKSSRRSTSRSPSRSPRQKENKGGYKVRFTLEGSLGLGYHWIEGIGPKIKALRPNSQADGRVRVVFEREAREFQSFHTFVFQLRHSN